MKTRLLENCLKSADLKQIYFSYIQEMQQCEITLNSFCVYLYNNLLLSQLKLLYYKYIPVLSKHANKIFNKSSLSYSFFCKCELKVFLFFLFGSANI